MSERTSLPLAGTTGTAGTTDDSRSGCGSGCGCGHGGDVPELDARAIPHALRHGAVLGALSALPPGASMVLVAPHDPKPLLAQMDQLFGEAVQRSYVQEGPDAWKLLLVRVA